MKVLVWGGDSWANQGDDSVLAGTVAAIRRFMPGAQVLVASDRPAMTASRHRVQAVRRASLSLVRALRRADLVVWGGGMLIQNQSSRVFLLVQVLFILAALALRKKTVGFAQGAGPVRGRVSRRLLHWVLNRLDLITVRDRASARRLRALGVRGVREQADPSFCVAAAPAQEADAALRQAGITGPFMAVALRRWGHYGHGWLPLRWSRRRGRAGSREEFPAFLGEVAAGLDSLAGSEGLGMLFVSMCPGGDQEDDEVAAAVRGLMLHGQRTRVLREWLPAPTLKAVLGRAELVVAMRTHAAMIAAGAGVPVLSISYQGKGWSFMSGLGLAEYCLPWQRVTRERLAGMASCLLRRSGEVRRVLRAQAPALEERALGNAKLVARLARQHRPGNTWERLYNGQGRLAPLMAARRRQAQALLEAMPCDRVVDVGCGPDGYAGVAPGRWAGVDTSLERLSRAPSGCVARGDLRMLPLGTGLVSHLLAIGVLDYLRPEDLPEALREIARSLRPDGRAVVSLNRGWWGAGLRAALSRRAVHGVRTGCDLFDHTGALGAHLSDSGLRVARTQVVRGGWLAPDTLLLVLAKGGASRAGHGTV